MAVCSVDLSVLVRTLYRAGDDYMGLAAFERRRSERRGRCGTWRDADERRPMLQRIASACLKSLQKSGTGCVTGLHSQKSLLLL